MTTAITTTITPTIGQIANTHAAAAAFTDYRERKAKNTIERQGHDLALFAQYLADVHINVTAEALATSPEAWRGITWGLVAGFVRWQLLKGFAVRSVNVRLSTVKTYAKLAAQAGAIDTHELTMIKCVSGYSRNEGENADKVRETKRQSTKKAQAAVITDEQAKVLKIDHPDTPQGRRDKLMMCLLLNLGLRVGEIVSLKAADFDVNAGIVTFYREKVKKSQTHRLINGAWDAARAYIAQDVTDPNAPLLRASNKSGTLTHQGMTRFGIAQRVRQLGKTVGIENLSPHDCRHSWATRAAQNKTDAFSLRDAGGWSSMAMPGRYVDAAKIANEGIKLDSE